MFPRCSFREPDDHEETEMSLEKVGRLKPGEESDSIRVIMDEFDEIGRISRERMEMIILRVEPVMSSSEVNIDLRVGGEMIQFLGWQVRGMMEKWPRNKARVFRNIANIY